MKTSWTKLFQFADTANNYLRRTKTADTKLKYAIDRLTPQVVKAQEKINKQFEKIDVDHAAVDDDGVLKRGAITPAYPEGVYRFTREEQHKRDDAKNKLCEVADIEIEPYFATKVPDDLTELELIRFEGLVISKEQADAIRAGQETAEAPGEEASAKSEEAVN